MRVKKKLQVQGNVACGMDEMKDARQHFLLGKASLVGLSFVSSPIKDDGGVVVMRETGKLGRKCIQVRLS
jgi:hypothetical protein